MNTREITGAIVDSAIRVHKSLGPGLLESVYEACLHQVLTQGRIRVERQVSVPVKFESVTLDCGVRLDLLVENSVIIELKAVDSFAPIHYAQALTYLKLTGLRTCLLLNFNVVDLRKNGIRRIVN